MRYLSSEDILQIHSVVIDETGGAHGVRDMYIVLSLENSPKQIVLGKELYPNVFEKAALYARNIISNHPFIDGNKRTGMAATFVFLEDNELITKVEEGEIEEFALKIIKEKLEIKEIAVWLKKHFRKSRPTKSSGG